MDATRFDMLTRAIAGPASRRGFASMLGTSLGACLATRLPGAVAGKKRKKGKKLPPFNDYGCLSVGEKCGGNPGVCCSGVSRGKKPKPGRKDKRRCGARNVGDCALSRNLCQTGNPAASLCGTNAVCLATTGNAPFCAYGIGFTIEANCVDCQEDQDCEALGFPKGSACVVMTGDHCIDLTGCAGVNNSSGTACLPPGP